MLNKKNPKNSYVIKKSKKTFVQKIPQRAQIFKIFFWKHGNLRSITKKLEELNYQRKDKLNYKVIIYTKMRKNKEAHSGSTPTNLVYH